MTDKGTRKLFVYFHEISEEEAIKILAKYGFNNPTTTHWNVAAKVLTRVLIVEVPENGAELFSTLMPLQESKIVRVKIR